MKHGGFTPGPWEVGETLDGMILVYGPPMDRKAGTGYVVAHARHWVGEYGRAEANARLVADAPALYAENQQLLSLLARAFDEVKAYQEGDASDEDVTLLFDIRAALKVAQ